MQTMLNRQENVGRLLGVFAYFISARVRFRIWTESSVQRLGHRISFQISFRLPPPFLPGINTSTMAQSINIPMFDWMLNDAAIMELMEVEFGGWSIFHSLIQQVVRQDTH